MISSEWLKFRTHCELSTHATSTIPSFVFSKPVNQLIGDSLCPRANSWNVSYYSLGSRRSVTLINLQRVYICQCQCTIWWYVNGFFSRKYPETCLQNALMVKPWLWIDRVKRLICESRSWGSSDRDWIVRHVRTFDGVLWSLGLFVAEATLNAPKTISAVFSRL